MSRYTDPKCRLCRREHNKLFLKGERCFTDRCAVERRKSVPGMHGAFGAKRLSAYGLRLREKQKARRIFGLTERQFRKTYNNAVKTRGVETGELLFQKLELRLDSVVYHMGLVSSRAGARQLLSHRHIFVNGKLVTIASYEVKVGDVIAVSPSIRNSPLFQKKKDNANKEKSKVKVPAWIFYNPETFEGKILYVPSAKELNLAINPQYIIEFYSR